MSMIRTLGSVAVLLVFLPAVLLTACARSDESPQSLAFRDAWARPADSGMTSGAYLSLINTDTLAVAITGWRSDASETTSLHETAVRNGMTSMSSRPRVDLPRDGALDMAPGGLHLMLERLTRTLRAGDTVQITATLADGRDVMTAVVVRAR